MDLLKADHNQTISPPIFSLPHIRSAQGRQMQPQGNMDTHCVHIAISGSTLHLQILEAVICPPWCMEGTLLAPKKLSQMNISTIILFFAPLSQRLLQVKAHVPSSLHLSFLSVPQDTHSFRDFCQQQTTIQTRRSSTHLPCKHTFLYTQQGSELQ